MQTVHFLGDLGWQQLVAALSRRCISASVRAALAIDGALLLDDATAVEDSLDAVCEAMALAQKGDPLPFGELFEIVPYLLRLGKHGELGAEALLEIAATLRSIDRLRAFLLGVGEGAPRLLAYARELEDCAELWRDIADCFTADGTLADHASPELGRVRAEVSRLQRNVTREMRRLIETPHIAKFLQDTFFTEREDRYVLPVRSDAGPAVQGIVHGASASGATIFVEPREVVELNNQLKVAQVAVLREEARIYRELSQQVAERSPAIRHNLELAHQLDLIHAKARLGHELNACRPRLATDGAISLRAARHPLLMLKGTEVVPSTIHLAAGSALIISGPNAGGKTVALKTIGLCALMLRAGMPLPVAPESALPFYDEVFAEIGDAQSLEKNLSTFTAHMSQLATFHSACGPASLVLVDEIATGTDPGQGEALAQALLEAFVARGAQVIATTHYELLKALPTRDKRFVNANVGFHLDEMRPTFVLHLGTPGTSFALAVARRQGIDSAVAQRAEDLLARQEHDLALLLTDLAQQQAALELAHDAASSAAARAREQEHELRAQRERLKAQGKLAHDAAHRAAIDELMAVRRALSALRVKLRQPVAKEQWKALDAEVSEAAKKLAAHEPRTNTPPVGPAVAAAELQRGTIVFVPRLGEKAEVVEEVRRGKVVVSVGGFRTTVAVSELRLPSRSPARRQEASSSRGASKLTGSAPSSDAGEAAASGPERTPDNTLDVRGMRADEAISEAERFLDAALLAGRDYAFILHGHGSGALRKVLRQALTNSPMVAKLGAAATATGGDALTLVELR